MKSRLLKIIGIIGLTAFVAGCAHIAPRLVNLTPELMPTNPSGIYTFSLLLDSESKKESVNANVVIGGSIYSMNPKPGKSNVLSFDYSIPSSQNRAKYYYEILDSKGEVVSKSRVYDLRLTNRYVVELESTRAQPGQSISVLGKGFRSEDKISFGGTALESRFISGNQLEFDVPAFEGGIDYSVGLETSSGLIEIGVFRIDYSELRSVPSRLILLEGQTATVVFSIDREAPAGGIPLEVNVSDSSLVDYEPISIEEGSRSVSLQFTGGAPGSGSISVRAAAHNDLLLPLEVQSRIVE